MSSVGRGWGGCAARLSLFVLFSLFNRPRAGLATTTVYKVVFRVGNQDAECEKRKQNLVSCLLSVCSDNLFDG